MPRGEMKRRRAVLGANGQGQGKSFEGEREVSATGL